MKFALVMKISKLLSEPKTVELKTAVMLSFDGFNTTKNPGFPDLTLEKKNKEGEFRLSILKK